MGDSGSDAGASIHASFRNLHRAAAPGVCGVKKKSISFRLLGRVPRVKKLVSEYNKANPKRQRV